MKKPKEIPRNNVIVVDGVNVRAVFYHTDPQRIQAVTSGIVPYIGFFRSPYLIVIGVN